VTPSRWDVGCAADLCVDLILSGNVVPRFGQAEQWIDGYALELGGSGTIFGGQFARLGGGAALVGVIGEDAFGALVREQLREIGVPADRVRIAATVATGLGVSLVKPDGDRGMLTYSGGIGAVEPADLTEELLVACRHWHVASYFLLEGLRAHWPEWLRRCRAHGVTTSLDTNWDPEDRWEGVRELLPLVDVFLPNEQEACAIAREADVFEAGRQLSDLGPLVVIKRGSEGATAFRSGERWEMGQPPAGEPPLVVVDSVGAGDNFDAGFLRGWLLGWDVTQCLRLGGRCARASLRHAGGFRGQLQERVR
jgi:sugar/nucleoside kinase (ribokinase family)